MAKKIPHKKVSNRNSYKLEIPFEDKIYVFPPRTTVSVPELMEIPSGLGLTVRK